VVAKAIGRAANARRPKARYRVGFGAKPLVLLHTLLPTRWFDYFMTRAFR
jgi:oxidoreductase, short chain dehydrogenase/reductase family